MGAGITQAFAKSGAWVVITGRTFDMDGGQNLRP